MGTLSWYTFGFFIIVIYEALCFDMAQDRMNEAPDETRTFWCSFARIAYQPLHQQRCAGLFV